MAMKLCEQECNRIKQQLQDLTAKKDRLEKLIADISNNDKLKQIVKENVKVVLSENRKLISISFVALIQTIKADPEMVRIIQNIPNWEDGEQYKDDHTNINQNFESNMNKILDLVNKNYENLVEVFANNAIDNTIFSSNPTLSLPQSSCTFPNLANQSDIHRKEESEIYDNGKGNIAE